MLSAHSTAACRHTLCAHWAPFLQLRPGPSCAAGAVALTGARTPLLQGASETKKSRRQEKKSPACLRGHGHGLSCARRTAALQAGGRQHRCANERALRGKATPRPHIAFVPGSAAAPTGRTARGDRARGRLLTCGSGGHGPGTGGRRGDRAERPGPEDPAAARPPTAATAPRPPQPPSAPRLPLPPAAMATRRRSLPLPGRRGLAGALRWSGIAPRGRGRRPQNPAGSPEPRDHLPFLRGFPAPKRCPARSAPRFLPLPRGCTGAALAAPRPWMGEKGRGDGAGRPRPRPAPRPPQAQLQRAFAFRSSGSTAAALPRSAPRVYSRLARAARAAAPPGRSEPFKIKSTDRARIVVGSTWTASKGKRGVVPEPRRGGSRICPLGCRALPVPRVGGAPSPGRGHRAPPGAGLPLGALRREGFGPGSSQTSKPRAFVLPCSSAGKCTRGQQQPGMLCLK